MSDTNAQPRNVETENTTRMRRGLLAIMALACGAAVANVYFPQALTPLIANELGVPGEQAAQVATAAQVGYAIGIFFLVPLGDRMERRRLVTGLLAAVTVLLVVAGTAPGLGVLVAASTLIGITTVVPQLLIPLGTELSDEQRRGRVIGTLQSGLLAGILLARAFGGGVGDLWGFRGAYLVATGLMAAFAVMLALRLPSAPVRDRPSYGSLLASAGRYLRTEPDVRRSCLYGATLFGAFSAVWTSLALLLTRPPFSYGPGAIGLIAIVGAVTVFLAPLAGRLADRRGPDLVNLLCILGLLASAAVLLAGQALIVVLIAGILLLDVAVQCSQVANQSRVFAVDAAARSRLNTVYMTSTFLGGAIGSWVGLQAWGRYDWPGVCVVVAGMGAIALAAHLINAWQRSGHRAARRRGGALTS
jgi:predicted MFS family arabinose efflux permease